MKSFQISEIERLLHGMVRICTVSELGKDGKVKVTDGEMNSTWLYRGVMRAGGNIDWRPLDLDEQVLVLCPSGDFAQGMIIASLYQQKFKPEKQDQDEERITFSDQSTISYHRKNHHYDIHLTQGATATIQADGGIKLIGDTLVDGQLRVTGDVKVEGDSSLDGSQNVRGNVTSKGDVVAGKISLQRHLHDVNIKKSITLLPK